MATKGLLHLTPGLAGLAGLGLLGALVLGCGGTGTMPGAATCTEACGAVAAKCGGNTGAIGNRPGGCPAACAEVAAGPGTLTSCARAALSCDEAQACFTMPTPGQDGGPFIGLDLGTSDGTAPPPDAPVSQDGRPSGCGEEEIVGSTRVVPNVLLTLDQSGSMSMQDFGANNEQRLTVLQRVANSVVANPKLEGKIRWGLTAFPIGAIEEEQQYQQCLFGCPDPLSDPLGFIECDMQCASMFSGCRVFDGAGDPVVPVADNNVAAVQSGISGMQAAGNTPIAEVLGEAAEYLARITTSEHPSYVVLGTDGEPTCTEDAGARSIAMAEMLAAMGIKTFVIGISSSVAGSDTLNQLAVAGGAPRMDNPRFYPAQNEAELVSALTEITTAIASCTFRLERPAPNPLAVQVYLGKNRVDRDDTNGFSYLVDMNGDASITLNGEACTQFQTLGAKAQLEIVFGCAPQG